MEVNTKKAVWLLAVPAFLTGILAYLENNFFAIFLTNVAMLSNEAYTKVTVTGASIIAFSSLVSGILVQKVNFKKGKNRPWLIPMSIAIVIGRYMQFTPIKAAESTLVLWFMGGYVLTNFAYSVTSICYDSIVQRAITEPNLRVNNGAYRMLATNLAQFLFSLVAITLIDKAGYSVTSLIVSLLTLAGYAFCYATTKNIPDATVDSKGQITDEQKLSFWQMIKYSIFNRCVPLFVIGNIIKTGANMVCMMTMAYYYTYVAGDMSLMTIYMSITTFLSIFGAFITPFLARLFKGPRNTYCWSLAIYALGLIAAFFFAKNVLIVTVCLCIMQLFWGVYMAASGPLFMGCIDYAENKSGKDLRGFLQGINTFSIKAGNILATTTIGIGLAKIGFNAANMPESAVKALPVLTFLVPAIYSLITVVLYRLLPLTNEYLQKLADENAARRAAQQQE